LLTTDF